MQRTITEHFADDREDIVHSRDVDWHEVRAARNQALLECDWRAGKDVVLSTAWKEYRQALRDLGGFASSNEACDNWPVRPDE
jgi:hypothetical protein